MSRRVLCKFYMQGACLKGEYCEFSHDRNDQPNNICTFYQKGACSYGSRCRYDHVKLSRNQPSSSASPTSAVCGVGMMRLSSPAGYSLHKEYESVLNSQMQQAASNTLVMSHSEATWSTDIQQHTFHEGAADYYVNPGDDAAPVDPAELPICSFAAAGSCPYGEACPQMHGDVCSICGKECLHPFRPDEREEHTKSCQKNHKRLDALKRSQEIECSVCLDRVLSKSTPAERKFGLLSECDHPFCISCIRNWRSNSPSSGMDVNSALRACPICRKLSYYVIPSVIWYFSKDDKQEIIDAYKARLKSIDCKYFDFGVGNCPFGTSCFYKHAYRDGRLEEVTLRHLDADDGTTVIAKNIRLSDFFGRMQL